MEIVVNWFIYNFCEVFMKTFDITFQETAIIWKIFLFFN